MTTTITQSVCEICFNICIIPVQMTCFSCWDPNQKNCHSIKRFCMECADQYLKWNGDFFKKCIYCDATVDLASLINRRSNYNIDFLTMSFDTRRISCINKDCDYEGSQNDILRHLKLCDYVSLKCKGCFQQILQKDMSSHINSCPHYIQCGVCKTHCLREKEYEHHLYEYQGL